MDSDKCPLCQDMKIGAQLERFVQPATEPRLQKEVTSKSGSMQCPSLPAVVVVVVVVEVSPLPRTVASNEVADTA